MADEPQSASSKLADAAILHGINIQRVTKGIRDEVLSMLVDLRDNLLAQLSSDKSLTAWKKQKIGELINFANGTIDQAYTKVGTKFAKDLNGISQAAIKQLTNSVNNTVGVSISAAMSAKQLQSIANTQASLVQGATQKDWWSKQSGDLQHSFTATIQQGMLTGQGIDAMKKPVQALMENKAYQAEALVRTAVATVQSEAQQAYYAQNDDIIKGVQLVATLDGRTTILCRALDGKSWVYDADQSKMKPVGHGQKWLGYPPLHWNCRSTTIPVLREWSELSQKKLSVDEGTVSEAFQAKLEEQGFTPEEAAKIELDQQASMDGQVSADLTYEEWLKSKPESFQQQVLGPERWQLWNDGKIGLDQMIDGNGQPLTIAEMHKAIDNNVAVPVTSKEEGADGLSLAERGILQAELTDGNINGVYHSTWLDKNTGKTTDQAFIHTLSEDEYLKLTGWSEETAGREVEVPKLVHLSNSLAKTEPWDISEIRVWASVPGFSEAKLVLQDGKVATVALKQGQEWTKEDAVKYAEFLPGCTKTYQNEGPLRAAACAFKKTGKVTWSVTKVGTVEIDPKSLKMVYPPIKEKPAPYFTPGPTEAEIAKQEAISAALAKAEALHQQAAEASQIARQAAIDAANVAAAQRLNAHVIAQQEAEAAAEKAAKELAEAQAKAEAEALAAKKAAEEAAALKKKQEEEAAAKAQAEKDAKDLDEFKQKLKNKAVALAEYQDSGSSGSYDAYIQLTEAVEQAQALNPAFKGELATKLWNNAKAEAKLELHQAKVLAEAEAAAKLQKEIDDSVKAITSSQEAFNAAMKWETDAFVKWQAGDMTLSEYHKISAIAQQAKLKAPEMLQGHLDATVKAWQEAQAAQAAAELKAKKSAAAAKGAATKKANAAKKAQAALDEAQAAAVTQKQVADVWPVDPLKLDVVKPLGGSTGAELVKDEAGNLFVRKTGNSGGHILAESAADDLYRLMGQDVPEHRLYSTPEGPVKLAKFIEGKEIGKYVQSASESERNRIYGQVQHGFVSDALLANWDVLGLSSDNMLVDKTGKVWRIDNGGSFSYKATGGDKPFKREVTELKTLLDPAKNPNASKVFAGITQDQISDQIWKIVDQKEAIIAATPKQWQAAMRERIDFLEEHANPRKAGGMGAWASDPAVVKRIDESGINGVSLWTDKGDVEDAEALGWTEKDKQGNPTTVVQLKLTQKTAEALEARLKPFMGKSADALTVAAQAMQTDTFYHPLLSAAKTIATHLTDGAYNKATIQAALSKEFELNTLIHNGSETEKKMAQMYKDYLETVKKSIVSKDSGGQLEKLRELKQFDPTLAKPEEKKKDTSTLSSLGDVKVLPLRFDAKSIDKGDAKITGGAAHAFKNGPIMINIEGDDILINYIPAIPTNGEALSFQGQIEIRAKGAPTPEVMAKIQNKLSDIGIDVTPPTDEYQKTVYLIKNIYLLNKNELPADLVQIQNDLTLTDPERFDRVAKLAKKSFGLELNPADERWKGRVEADGEGFRYWDRLDLSREEIKKQMRDYYLTHDITNAGPDKIDQFLNSGGQITPTNQRMRKGIPLTEAKGMSSVPDMGTGGSAYFFTRIRKKAHITGGSFVFDISQLSRLDSWSFPRDVFGKVREPGVRKERQTTIAGFIKNSANPYGNETDFKNGFNMVDDVKYIVVHSETERQKTIKVIKSHGITKWGDGRALTEVVVMPDGVKP